MNQGPSSKSCHCRRYLIKCSHQFLDPGVSCLNSLYFRLLFNSCYISAYQFFIWQFSNRGIQKFSIGSITLQFKLHRMLHSFVRQYAHISSFSEPLKVCINCGHSLFCTAVTQTLPISSNILPYLPLALTKKWSIEAHIITTIHYKKATSHPVKCTCMATTLESSL